MFNVPCFAQNSSITVPDASDLFPDDEFPPSSPDSRQSASVTPRASLTPGSENRMNTAPPPPPAAQAVTRGSVQGRATYENVPVSPSQIATSSVSALSSFAMLACGVL